MESNNKSPSYNIGDGSLVTDIYCEDNDRYKEKKYSRTLSLQNLSSIEKQTNIFNRTFNDYERAVRNQSSNNGHYKLPCDDINEVYTRNELSLGETGQRFSPEHNYQNSTVKTNGMKKGEVLKEQTNQAGGSGIWQQQKKYRLPNDQMRVKKTPHSLSGSTELLSNQFLPYDGAIALGSMHGVRRDGGTMLQSYQPTDDQLLNFSSHSSANCASPGVKSMQIGKAYGGAAPHGYPTDLSCAAGINMCGGDSLMRTAMTHNEQPGKWDELNRKYYTEKKYDQQRAAAIKSNEAKVLGENGIVAMNVSSVSSSAAKDLSQHSVNSSSVLREDSNAKGFSLVSLPPHLQDTRHGGSQEAPITRDSYNAQNEVINKEKRYSIPEYKHVWGNFESPSHFSEQHQQQGRPHHHQHPYEATYCSECHSVPHVSSSPYEMNSMFLKDHSVGVKQELRGIHPGALPMTWDKGPATLLGSICKPPADRESAFYMKPPPVDLDDLSEDERERMRVKRERNRVAAAKCRNRRRELLERLEKEAEQLEREQEVLRDNVKRLQAQKRKLGSMLDKHEPGCSNKIEETPNTTYNTDAEVSSEQNVAE